MDPAEVIDFLDVAIDEDTPKPRVAVVMSPRFVTQEQFDAAVEIVETFALGRSEWQPFPNKCSDALKDIMLPLGLTVAK